MGEKFLSGRSRWRGRKRKAGELAKKRQSGEKHQNASTNYTPVFRKREITNQKNSNLVKVEQLILSPKATKARSKHL